MPDAIVLTIHVAAAASCALMAGVFFAFSVAVMLALGRRPAAEGMAAMQAINARFSTELSPPTFCAFAREFSPVSPTCQVQTHRLSGGSRSRWVRRVLLHLRAE